MSLYNKTAIRRRPVIVVGSVDSHGKPLTTLDTSLSFACALQSRKGREMFDGKKVVVSSFVAYSAPVDVLASDELEIDGVRFNVVYVADDGGRGHHLRIDLLQVDDRAA